jgi:hypothetical protein
MTDVPKTWVGRALVPDATRSSVLVVAGARATLPSWTLEDPEPVDMLRAARAAGVTTPFLREVRQDGDSLHDDEVRTLHEFDAADGPATDGLVWMPFHEALAGRLDAGPFDEDVKAWVDEVRSGAIVAGRSDWARPGWYERTAAWLDETMARLGRPVVGSVEQLGSWPVSSFLGADTDAGRVVMKASPSLFAHEPALTQAIHAAHPGSVPSVLAIDVDRRLLLMDAFGGSTLGAEDAARWAEGLVAMAGIQQAWVGRRSDAIAVGVIDRSLAALDAEHESLLTDEAASPGLDGESRDRLIANLPRYRESIARLQDGPVPETLIHGDFHPWNVQRDGDRLLIFDWSDACWSHPFFDVRTCTTRTEDGAAQASMESAYLESWSGYADHASLRDALRLAAPLTELHLSISWQRLMPIFEPGVYRFVDTGVQRHLELALAATDPPA